MTVIVWDGAVFAADRFTTDGQYKHPSTKIYRLPSGDLVGMAGGMSRGMALLDWAYKGFDPANYPELEDKGDYAEMLRITKDGMIIDYEDRWPMKMETDYYAIGSGAPFAQALLHLGTSAVETVKVVSELCASCGLGVDSLKLFDVD